MFPSLRINTESIPVHKAKLTASEIADLKGKLNKMAESTNNNNTKYQQLSIIIEKMDGKFEDRAEYNQMEINMAKGGLYKDKPESIKNILLKVLERVTNTGSNASGGARKRKTRKAAAKRKGSRRVSRK